MDYDSLSSPDRDSYHATVRGSHERRIKITVLTLDGDPVRSLPLFLGGAINGDADQTPIETCEIDVLDEDEALSWSHGEHRRFKLQVVDARFVPALDDWVECVVFTGPLWDFERTGPVVSLVAQGSERLAMGSVRSVFRRSRKAVATSVIKDLLSAAGALRSGLLVPNLSARLPERVTVGVKRDGPDKDKKKDDKPRVFRYTASQSDTYYPEASRIAQAIHRELFPDGRGRFVLAPPANKPAVVLDNSTLLAPVVEKRATDGEQTNVWEVFGPDPKGPKKSPHAKVTLPRRHPLSREELAWHGKPREVVARIDNKHIRSDADARQVGAQARDRAVRELTTYEVQALPVVPWLRPRSLASIPTSGGRARTRVVRWTLPLGPTADPLVIGANMRRGWSA